MTFKSTKIIVLATIVVGLLIGIISLVNGLNLTDAIFLVAFGLITYTVKKEARKWEEELESGRRENYEATKRCIENIGFDVRLYRTPNSKNTQ